jgi:hypothetical protein
LIEILVAMMFTVTRFLFYLNLFAVVLADRRRGAVLEPTSTLPSSFSASEQVLFGQSSAEDCLFGSSSSSLFGAFPTGVDEEDTVVQVKKAVENGPSMATGTFGTTSPPAFVIKK